MRTKEWTIGIFLTVLFGIYFYSLVCIIIFILQELNSAFLKYAQTLM